MHTVCAPLVPQRGAPAPRPRPARRGPRPPQPAGGAALGPRLVTLPYAPGSEPASAETEPLTCPVSAPSALPEGLDAPFTSGCDVASASHGLTWLPWLLFLFLFLFLSLC